MCHFLLFFWSTGAIAGTSQLWGEAGELWDPDGRLPDFSWAGYAAGEAPIPDVEVAASVLDFGALGDDTHDDTAAFQAAIDATETGAILIPAGTYRLDGQLFIRKSGIVLRGEGRDQSILSFRSSLTDLLGAAPQWSWNGGLLHVEPPSRGGPLTTITEAAIRGDATLALADATGLEAGDWIVLRLYDDAEGTLGRHLYAEQTEGGDCTWQRPLTFDWPVRIADVEGTQVTLSQPLRTDVRTTWAPEIRDYTAIHSVGFEDLRVRFPDTPYPGHLDEEGYNGIFMVHGVYDSWARRLAFENADNGILTDQLSKRITAEDILFEGRTGHHGLNIAHTSDSLFTRLHYRSNWVHAMTVDHRANGNVFSEVSAEDVLLEMDHHKDSPLENLFTAFEAEANLLHGGSTCAGLPGGARNTFWGMSHALFPPYWSHIQTNIVGLVEGEESLTEDREWLEPVDDLRPRNLHRAQLALRLYGAIEDTAVETQDTDVETQDTDVALAPTAPEDDSGCGCRAVSPAGLSGLVVLGLGLTLRRRGRRA